MSREALRRVGQAERGPTSGNETPCGGTALRLSHPTPACDCAGASCSTAVSLPPEISGPPEALPRGAAATGLADFMAISKSLADENRVRLLLALREQELCLCQLVEMIGLAPSTVSKHMSILRQARLVVGRKKGRWQYFRLAGPKAPPSVRQAIEWAENSLAADPQVVFDVQRLKRIVTMNPSELCESQCGASE
jgi:ArsR family transcriptional regulator, arsenate/arsenite/antimonite-responsive transcriptional repressor